MIIWLYYQLTDIGWANVWHSLPTNPLFYLLFVIIYFSLPFTELFIYRLSWTFSFRDIFPSFVLKKVYNKDVMGYSGEVYLYLWARRNLKLKDSAILKTIKDNNIISSVTSTLVTVLLLGTFVFTGQIKLLDWLQAQNTLYIYGGIILLVILVLLTIRFRHLVISMPLKSASMVFTLHFFRLIIVQTIQVLQWYIVLPSIPFYVWFTFVSFQIVMSRIPFLPNNDLIFLGASIKMTQMMHIPIAGVAAVMVVNSVLGKLVNFIIFSGMSMFKKKMAIPISTVKDETPTLSLNFSNGNEPVLEKEVLSQDD